MQTSVRTSCAVSTGTSPDTDAQLNEPSLQDEEDHDGTLVIALEEAEESPATEAPVTQGRAPAKTYSKTKSDSQCDSTAPAKDLNVKAVQAKTKKVDKPVRDGRKYVPSKKAMTDPLKIDMSKPLATPLSSSQISLQCIECHIIFSDHKSKERHLKSSHPAEYEQSILRNALFACYVCDRHFTNSSELMAHQKTHIEKKPFKCPICSTTFCKLSELSTHKKIHFGQHGYTCTECGKPCKTLTLLKYHCRTHTGERPYVCKECGKRFIVPKALQKHLETHLPEGQQPKKDGPPAVVYPCSICKAVFKSTKTRLYHMRKKHNLSKAVLTKTGAQLFRQCTPIITPISISQPSLLQVGPNGPLQKVDANIDTEQLRRLIESLGNIQKVNQVVILGQVPPDAAPLQVPQSVQPVTLNIEPPRVDFMLTNPQSNAINDPMEQTIILEPITPDGQLLNPPFSALDPNVGANPVAEVIFQQPNAANTEQQNPHEMVCQNTALEQSLGPNLNQTIVLELTPALTPTAVLEQSGNVLQSDVPPSTSVQNNDLKMPDMETSISAQETSMSVQSLLSTVELEMMPLQPDQQLGPVCAFSPQETLPEFQTQTVAQEEADSLTLTNDCESKVQNPADDAEKLEERLEDVPKQGATVEPKAMIVTEETEKERKKEGKTINNQGKKVEEVSELPVNIMSAQELVKVRKRKPPKAFFFQGHMQEFVSSIYDEFPSMAANRKRSKKCHLVVKFGPPSKGKQSKKGTKPSKQPTKEDLKDKAPKSKIQKKSQKDKKVVTSESMAEIEVPAPVEENDITPKQKNTCKNNKKKQKMVEIEVPAPAEDNGITPKQKNACKNNKKKQKMAEIEVPAPAEENDITPKQKNTCKNNKKKQKVSPNNNEKHIAVVTPVFKKKQKKIIQSKSVKGKSESSKQKASNKAKEKSSPQSKAAAADKATDKATSHVIQDSLLLLKGHKQPQLKVHKLDPLQTSCKAQDVSSSESQTSPNDKSSPTSSETSAASKKKGGRSKKVLTLLSSLMSKKQEQAAPPKPTPTRKRKASSKVETEGIITSKKSIECKECGQRFGDVPLLQHHKATVHIVESPGITFTNGNLFEGVTGDLYQIPKEHGKVTGLNTDWDTEPEMAELERERCVTFPALNASPSLPVPPCDIYCSYEDARSGKDCEDGSSPKVLLPSPQLEDATKEHRSCADMEVQATTEEDIKEDLVLEIDLVTVGEQKDDSTLSENKHPQNKETEQVGAEREGLSVKETDPTLHTVSCSTHQHNIKDEEDEMVIDKRKGGQKEVASIERESEKGEASVDEAEEQVKQGECEILYERPTADLESDNNQDKSKQVQISSKSSPQKDVAPDFVQSLRGDEEARVDQEAASSKNDTEVNEQRQDEVQSPAIILEKVISSNLSSADKGTNQRQLLENENQQIKMEDSTADSTPGVTRCSSVQSGHRDIRAVLVKEESRETPQTDGQIQWSTEQTSNSSSPLVNEAVEATDQRVAQSSNSSQCIFFPVKEEEREVLVGPSNSGSRPASSEVSSAQQQPVPPTPTNEFAFATPEVLSESGLSNPSDGQSAETEGETSPNLCDFLLQSSDEEDSTSEWIDSHIDSEAEIMSHLYKKQHGSLAQSVVGSATAHDGSGRSNVKKPIVYFSKYFNCDTWSEISHCTNKLANISSPVTAKEVAQFVGIHIAMGSLKYPSLRLYWDDLTRVPLVADAMPLPRFLELSHLLKLASPQDNQQNSNSRRDTNLSLSDVSPNRNCDNFQHHKTFSADPLWKIQPVLRRFVRGCRSLKRQGDYGIDQYPLPLSGRTHSNKHSLHCTTLVDFGGMVLDINFKLDPSHREDAAEKLSPKESMVFLCKQDLSTPAMLERLLATGVHGAGQVGGAKGHVGDEFVSSDGKLTLQRSQCGFILSTTGNGQRNSAALLDNFEKAQKSAVLNKKLQSLYSIPPSFFPPNRWPQTVLWFLTDLALTNSWLLYRQDAADTSAPLTLLSFRLEVSKALILTSGLDTQDSLSSSQSEEARTPSDAPSPSLLHENPLPDASTRYDGLGHWPEQLAEGEGGRCRFGGCQRTSRVLCLKCCVFLCISRHHNCFINFHNQGHQVK